MTVMVGQWQNFNLLAISHFLATTFDFTFCHSGFLGAAPFFSQLDCFCIDITSFYYCILQSQPVASFGVSFT